MNLNCETLKCVKCKSYKIKKEGTVLRCSGCNSVFPIINSIPVMLNDLDMDNSKKQLNKYYKDEAKIYNISHGSDLYGTEYNINRYYKKIFCKYLPKCEKILEFGAGTGRFSSIIKEFGKSCCLTDFSLEMLMMNREKKLAKICADTINLPFPNEYFDCCAGVTTFCYLPDKKEGIKELVRVTKPGGTIFILDQNRDSFVYLISKLYYLKKRKLNRQPQVAESNLRYLISTFNEAGLEIVDSGTLSWIPHALPKFAVILFKPVDYVFSLMPFLNRFAMRLFIVAKKPA